MSLQIRFEDLPHSTTAKTECEARVQDLKEQFPETTKYEVTLRHNKADHAVQLHVTGKDLEVTAHAEDHGLREAIVEAFERLERQLRKHHDKQIFGRRRETRSPRS